LGPSYDAKISNNDGGTNQKLILFICGKAMSGVPITSEDEPITKATPGITIKKIIIKAFPVTISLIFVN
jgi:Na+-translocating ferredoxin:NAD+ oxidoreductase RnfC subunit